MKRVMFKAWSSARTAKRFAKEGVKKFLKSEDGGVRGFVIAATIVIIIGLLVFMFREQITNWLYDVFEPVGPRGLVDESFF